MQHSPFSLSAIAFSLLLSGCSIEDAESLELRDDPLGEANGASASLDVESPILPASPIMPANYPEDLQWVEMDAAESAAALIGYNAAGEVIGRISVTADDAAPDVYHVVSEYADGGSIAVVDTDEDALISAKSSLSDDELAYRAELIGDMLIASAGPDPQAFEPALECGLSIAVAIASCLPSTVLVIIRCPGSSALAACKCIKAHSKGKSKCKKKEK